MKYKLINQPNKKFSAIQQILYNRGIPENEILHYLNLSDNDINSPIALGELSMKGGVKLLLETINKNLNAIIIVDCDCDGYTSAALLINYLHSIFPTWAQNHLTWLMHEGKQHGLSDCCGLILDNCDLYNLVICPDSASNDYKEHQILDKAGIGILILDHHLADHISKDAIVINNQLCDYPNKELSGVGVIWQFCRYIDSILKTNYADNFIDLVALGLCADMMSLRSFETRQLITKGFKKENIKNPFIDYMIDKNSFPLSKADYQSSDPQTACTSIGAAFFIVPFINAICRSGTLEEKQLVFNSMLNHKAFQKVISTKRGHKLGEQEQLILQAIRTVTNVKNRQTRAEDAGLEMLENMIVNNHMLNHKILLFLLKPGQIDSEIRGLIANKFMAKYQRPCCLLTYVEQTGLYEGSARGYTKNGLLSFKEIAQKCPGVKYVEGHDNACGLGIAANEIDNFLKTIDQKLENYSSEPIYRVDYDFKAIDNNNQYILDIANMNDYWGQDIERAYVNINFKITNSNFEVMKNNTVKISLPNNLSIIKFETTEEQINTFTTEGYLELNAICKCNANNWGGKTYPQLLMEDYEIIDSSKYVF